MTAAAVTADVVDAAEPAVVSTGRHHDWDVVIAHAPLFAVTAWRYLDQLAVSMRPATVDVADNTLRCFAGFIVDQHPELGGFVDVRRVEGFKLFFVAHITAAGKPPARNTIRQRFGMLRSFFDRIIEWDWDDAPHGSRSSPSMSPSPMTRCHGSSMTSKPHVSPPPLRLPRRSIG